MQHGFNYTCLLHMHVLLLASCIAPQGSQRTPATCIAATTPELMVEILNSVF